MRARWVLPAIAIVLALAGSLLLVDFDRYLARTGTTAAPEAALPILAIVLFGAVTLVIVLALIDARWTPAIRALPVPSASGTLAWLLGTIVFAVVGLGSVRLGAQPFAPAATTTLVALLFVVGLALFARYARALSAASDPYRALSRLAAFAVHAADAMYPPRIPQELPPPPPLEPGRVVRARQSGYVAAVDMTRLARASRRAQSIVEAPVIGAFIAAGEPMLHIHALDGRPVPSAIVRTVHLADTRDVHCDVAFGLELLSDFAIASVHDHPGVAEAALDRIDEVLGRIGPRPFPSGRFADKNGRLRVLQPVLPWPRLVEIALGDLAVRAGEDPSVRERLSALVDALSRRLAPDRAASLAPYAPFPRFVHAVERRIAVVDADVPGDGGAGRR